MSSPARLSQRCLLFAVIAGASAAAAEPDGAALFEQHCSPCHGPDGRARTPAARKLAVKDLTESHLADAEISRQIALGSTDAKGRPRMPAFKPPLTDADVAALVQFVKSLRK